MERNGFVTGLMYILMVFLAVGLAILVFFNFRANHRQMAELEAAEIAAATTPTPPPTETPEPTATPSRTADRITLAFAGDLVGQPGLTTDAASYTTTTDEYGNSVEAVTYDFYSELENIVPSLSGADFAACTVVGTISDSGAYENYHMPVAAATALAGVGFQVVNAATDHILDLGMDGLLATADSITGEGLVPAGIYTNQQLHGSFMANVHGVNVAILSYTYGTGGVSVAENPWCIDILTQDYMTDQTTVDYARIDADVAAVRSSGADVVVCFVYWWDNTQYYYQSPRSNQTDVVDHLFETGVDIVIGSGVKVPQRIETRVVERADGTKANCVACYSLSNMMSCFNDKYTNLSAVARIGVSRDTDTGEIWISSVDYRPLFMLDTDDYGDYDEPGYKYKLLDAYNSIENYENGGSSVSVETYDALLTGVSDLQSILGAAYDTANGGVTLDYPY